MTSGNEAMHTTAESQRSDLAPVAGASALAETVGAPEPRQTTETRPRPPHADPFTGMQRFESLDSKVAGGRDKRQQIVGMYADQIWDGAYVWTDTDLSTP